MRQSMALVFCSNYNQDVDLTPAPFLQIWAGLAVTARMWWNTLELRPHEPCSFYLCTLSPARPPRTKDDEPQGAVSTCAVPAGPGPSCLPAPGNFARGPGEASGEMIDLVA